MAASFLSLKVLKTCVFCLLCVFGCGLVSEHMVSFVRGGGVHGFVVLFRDLFCDLDL